MTLFYNIFIKIKYNFYISSGSASSPLKNSGCATSNFNKPYAMYDMKFIITFLKVYETVLECYARQYTLPFEMFQFGSGHKTLPTSIRNAKCKHC